MVIRGAIVSRTLQVHGSVMSLLTIVGDLKCVTFDDFHRTKLILNLIKIYQAVFKLKHADSQTP
jgi:hypothetical protein